MQKGNVIVHEVCHLAQFWIVTRARIIVILKVNLTKTIFKKPLLPGAVHVERRPVLPILPVAQSDREVEIWIFLG